MEKTELCHIMTKYGSDKGRSDIHNYTQYYSEIFGNIRNNVRNVFELGLGTNFTDVPSNMGPEGKPGASHRGWKEYFPNANIYGADIDARILFEEDRIKTYYCDQLNAVDINNMFKNQDLLDIKFDIIIEDGLHEYEANKSFILNSFNKLKTGGFYIIEDVKRTTKDSFISEMQEYKYSLGNFIVWIVELPHPNNSWDNSLIVFKKL